MSTTNRVRRDPAIEAKVEHRPHDYHCLVYATSGGVCDCGEGERRRKQRDEAIADWQRTGEN